MDIEVIQEPISIKKLQDIAAHQFGIFVKAVVDIEKQLMAIGGELHADEEATLLDQGSLQQNLWGINLYPAKSGDEFVEFDSMINVRPSQGNMSRAVEDIETQKTIRKIVEKLVVF